MFKRKLFLTQEKNVLFFYQLSNDDDREKLVYGTQTRAETQLTQKVHVSWH